MSTHGVSFRHTADGRYFFLRSGGDGDYERLLVSGMSRHLPFKDDLIQYERIGPFMPPMCITVGNIVVNDAMYRALLASEFSEFQVKPVIKAHISRSDWDGVAPLEHVWGEPEDQVLDKPHDPACAAELGDLYQVIPPVCGGWDSRKYNSARTECELVCPTFSGGDFFALQPPAPTSKTPMCSIRFRRWLEDTRAARWIQFIPATIIRP